MTQKWQGVPQKSSEQVDILQIRFFNQTEVDFRED